MVAELDFIYQKGNIHMFKSALTATLLLLANIFLLTSQVFAQLDEKTSDPPPIFNKRAFLSELDDQFDSCFMGAQVTLIKNGLVVAEWAEGKALASQDGGQDMNTSINANVGSVSKALTGFLLMRIVEEKSKLSGESVDDYLNRPIEKYLPDTWLEISSEAVRQITLRRLLQHKSNFVTSSDFPSEFLASGTNGTGRKYQNANFALLTYLIPILHNDFQKDFVNLMYDDITLDQEMRTYLGHWFMLLHRHELRDNAVTTPWMTCSPTIGPQQELNALNYTSGTDTENGAHFDDQVRLGYCHGAGGWYASTRDLMAIAATLQVTDDIMPKSLYQSLYNPKGTSAERNNRLVWSGEGESLELEELFGEKYYAYHGGLHTFLNGRRAIAALVKFPGSYHGAVIVNSPCKGADSNWLQNRLKDAFVASF